MSSDRFELTDRLGAGSFGEVFLARHRDTGQTVALKVLTPTAPELRDVRLREARIVGELPEHDNVVPVHDAGTWRTEEDGRASVYVASMYCPGGEITALAAASVGVVCNFVSQACRGLAFLHENGVIHHDIRPSNVLLDERGAPRLADFGLSTTAGAGPAVAYAPHAAPELLLGTGQAGFASDQYAMAMTLGHLLTDGWFCHDRPSSETTWPDVDRLDVHVPQRVRVVIGTATATRAEDRYGSIEEFKVALDAATPVVSFRRVNAAEWCSDDDAYVVRWGFSETTGYWLELRKNNRRNRDWCMDYLDEREARRHLSKLFQGFASRGQPRR